MQGPSRKFGVVLPMTVKDMDEESVEKVCYRIRLKFSDLPFVCMLLIWKIYMQNSTAHSFVQKKISLKAKKIRSTSSIAVLNLLLRGAGQSYLHRFLCHTAAREVHATTVCYFSWLPWVLGRQICFWTAWNANINNLSVQIEDPTTHKLHLIWSRFKRPFHCRCCLAY